METNEMNRKIAEWMGEGEWYIPYHGERYLTKQEAESERDRLVPDPNARDRYTPGFTPPNYHSDWNALMPVVVKIAGIMNLSLPSTMYELASELDMLILTITDLHLAVFNYINQNS